MNKDLRGNLLLLVLAGAFAILFVEVRFEHQRVLRDSGEGQFALIPVVAAGLLCFASLLGLAKAAIPRAFSTVLFVLGIATGLAGLYFHSEGEWEKVIEFVNPMAIPSRNRDYPPLLAPLSFTGLSTMGVILTAGGIRTRRQRKTA